MADYAYLAGHAYRGSETSQEELSLYFQGLNVTDRDDLVSLIREKTIDSKVSFKLVTAPGLKQDGDFSYLVIRGTVSAWDAMTDAQLWSPAALMQFLRIVLPFGDIWTPVMPYLISAITTMESEALDQVSFYKDTVSFTKFIKSDLDFVGTAITGHSLGGGLSIITGAITETPAVALSGPNTMLVSESTVACPGVLVLHFFVLTLLCHARPDVLSNQWLRSTTWIDTRSTLYPRVTLCPCLMTRQRIIRVRCHQRSCFHA
jgi:lipase ATG15